MIRRNPCLPNLCPTERVRVVTTDLAFTLGDAKNTILQRAADMGIHIIEKVHMKSDREFAEVLRIVMELSIKTLQEGLMINDQKGI